MRRGLIDTGAIYAFVVKTDQNHRAAVDFLTRWLKSRGTFLLVDLVFFEAMTLLKARTGVDVAVQAGRELRRNPIYKWTTLTPDQERETWAVFQKYVHKEWSYTDCALLVVSRQFKVPDVFSFDDDFRQMTGVRQFPDKGARRRSQCWRFRGRMGNGKANEPDSEDGHRPPACYNDEALKEY